MFLDLVISSTSAMLYILSILFKHIILQLTHGNPLLSATRHMSGELPQHEVTIRSVLVLIIPLAELVSFKIR